MIKPVKSSALHAVTARWIIFSGDKVLTATGELRAPETQWHAFSFLHHYEENVVELPPLSPDDTPYLPVFLLDLGGEEPNVKAWALTSLRSLLSVSNTDDFNLYSRAWQYVHFLRTHQYCGRCGSRVERVDWEMAMQCHQCRHRCYPRISPCIIVAIYRKGQILLAKGIRHKDTDMYSTIAGFVESGETLEDAVHREVMEEVGVKVKNLEYIDSQPWPFPHSLMMGYIAEYDGGDIVPQKGEIEDAHWFDIDKLPTIPPKLSIAWRLIDRVINREQ